jgi:hypothetical protein
MATEDFHQEMGRWKSEKNLLEMAKYKLSFDSSRFYWSMGIVLAIYLAIFSARAWIVSLNFGSLSGEWIFTILIVVMSLIVIWVLNSIRAKQNFAYENISYLSRKLDGQFG